MNGDPREAAAGPTAPQSASAFELLHAGVQRQLWRMGWTQLRPLQVKAIRHILGSTGHAILSAATASGKTEAAFLPILSKIADEPPGSIRVLYVGPLKALINDQFRRVEELCEHLQVPVHRWHGDVAAAHKAQLIDVPAGVLLITPESLESLFVNRSQYLDRLFGGLRFVVIDELHTFLATERGLHLRSLLHRLRAFVHVPDGLVPGAVTMVGLSATIGDPMVARRYLSEDHPDGVVVIDDASDKKETKLRIHGYRHRTDLASAAPDRDGGESARESAVEEIHRQMARDMVDHCLGHANLIFANAKADVEEFADLCGQITRRDHINADFLVHHGSLSAEIREDTEAAMKSGRAATTFCSSTLELGIDIGSVHMVGQIGAPWSVSSLKQRIGRSGRRDGEARVMRGYVECRQASATDDVFERLHLHLLQAIAVTQLMIEGWVEPDEPPRCDLSTLSQQIISAIAQSGGARADRLHRSLCREGAFRDVEPPLFAALLRALADKDVVEQMEGGDLILGLRGEKIRKDKGFYAVFQTPEAFAVLHEGHPLGTLELVPKAEDYLLFAGRRWQVIQIDAERLEIHVKPARGWKRPKFSGAGGEIHPRIRSKMKELLQNNDRLTYLDETAQSLLDDARQAAAETRICQRPLVALGPRKTAWMTWTGTKSQRTLSALCALAGAAPGDEEIALVFNLAEGDVRSVLANVSATRTDPLALAASVTPREVRKYDRLLDDPLLNIAIARGRLDVVGACVILDSYLF